MTKIKHLSVGVIDPKRAAECLANLSEGTIEPFHPVEEAYVCLWGGWEGEFVEFYPKQVHLRPTSQGAEFDETLAKVPDYAATHINLDVDLTGDEVIAIAKEYEFQHHFRPSHGGPLHEVWIENELLVELVTKDLRR